MMMMMYNIILYIIINLTWSTVAFKTRNFRPEKMRVSTVNARVNVYVHNMSFVQREDVCMRYELMMIQLITGVYIRKRTH